MKKSALLLLTVASLLVSSCKKDLKLTDATSINQANITEEQKKFIAEAKEWYTRNNENASKVGSQALINIGYPEWDKAGLYKHSIKAPLFIIVPLNGYIVNRSFVKKMSPNGFRNLLIRKYPSIGFRVDIMETHPDDDYLDKKKKETGNDHANSRSLINIKDFTGYVLIYNTKNWLRYGDRRENGKIVSTLKSKNSDEKK